jgi:cell division protein FtsQ
MSTITLGKNRPRLGGKTVNKRRRQRSRQPASGIGAFRFVRNTLFTLMALGGLAVLGAGLLYGYRWVTSSPYFGLGEVVISGNQHLTRGDLMALGDVELGENCVDLNVSEVERLISNSPWIESATVRRELPGRLIVNVTEREPAFWTVRDGKLSFADAEGRVIAPAAPGEYASMPMLRMGENVQGGEALQGFVNFVGSGRAPFDMTQVAWVRVLPSHQIEARLDTVGVNVVLDMDRWETQLARINTAWRDLARRGEFSRVASVQATGDKVWVRLRG